MKRIVPGFTSQRLHRHAAVRLTAVFRCLLGFALLFVTCFVWAQAGPASNRRQLRRDAASALTATPAQSPAPDPAPPAQPAPAPVEVLAPIQVPAHPPNVTWNGKELTVDADNSSLMEILIAVRSKTGAAVDMPGTASNERVAVHIGPAPIRDVLAALLYGTNYDYVIQATDDGEGLRSLVLTLRGGKDDDAVVATTDKSEQPGVRMMKGYAAPGKPAFQAAAEAALADQSNSDRAASPTESASSTDGTTPPPEPSAGAESASNGSQGTNGAPPADASSNSAAPGDGGIAPSVARTAASAVTSNESISGDTSTVHSMEDLQRLYEQRRQIQMQQNQAAGKPSN